MNSKSLKKTLLTILTVTSLAACSKNNDPEPTTDSNSLAIARIEITTSMPDYAKYNESINIAGTLQVIEGVKKFIDVEGVTWDDKSITNETSLFQYGPKPIAAEKTILTTKEKITSMTFTYSVLADLSEDNLANFSAIINIYLDDKLVKTIPYTSTSTDNPAVVAETIKVSDF